MDDESIDYASEDYAAGFRDGHDLHKSVRGTLIEQLTTAQSEAAELRKEVARLRKMAQRIGLLLSDPPRSPRMTDWQDISTAPRDGTRVKLLIPYNQNVFSEAQCTDAGHWAADEVSWDGSEKGCWRFDGDDGPFDIQPTHWMPLPPAPTVLESE